MVSEEQLHGLLQQLGLIVQWLAIPICENNILVQVDKAMAVAQGQ